MADWANKIVDAIQQIKQEGGQQNIMQPGRLVSVDPPIIEFCGVQIAKQVHVNPSMRTAADIALLQAAADNFMAKFAELETHKDSITEPKDLVDKLLELLTEPLQQVFDSVVEYHKKDAAAAGAQVMVRQDGNDIHVMSGTGG